MSVTQNAAQFTITFLAFMLGSVNAQGLMQGIGSQTAQVEGFTVSFDHRLQANLIGGNLNSGSMQTDVSVEGDSCSFIRELELTR